MKVAFYTYPSAFQNVGGGEILLLKMKEYLEKEGAQVDLFDPWHARIENYDVLQVFGSVKDCLGLVRVANTRRVKVAITPLWWSDFRRAIFTEGSLATKMGLVLRHGAKLVCPFIPSSRRNLLLASDLIFPNSEMEKKQIARLFAVPSRKMRVLYNGVDPSFSNADPALFRRAHGRNPFVLGVGRIEPRKNQLNLIRAMKKIRGLRLVLIGSAVSGYEAYFQQCQEEGKSFTLFIPTLGHAEALLKSAYAACELFVLQGWFETPGLAALEAALAGARVLVTSGGSTREYFKDLVDYLDPSSVSQMRQKIIKNLTLPKNDRLKERVLQNFTWASIAKKTIGFYQEALEN